jgi:hypothetical protein
MRKLAVVLALAPALALAEPQATPSPPGRGAGAGVRTDDPGHRERAEKRLRIARTVGLADALDLDEAGALRVRETLTRFDERRAPLRHQIQDSVRILRDAARGDTAAAAQVDNALARLRDARAQLQQVNAESLAQLTQGMPPQKKARAALFLARFQARAPRAMMMQGGPGGPGQPGHGSGPSRGEGPGTGPGMSPGRLALHGAPLPEMAEPFPDEEDDWFADE